MVDLTPFIKMGVAKLNPKGIPLGDFKKFDAGDSVIHLYKNGKTSIHKKDDKG